MRQARALLALPPRPGSAEADANAALQAAAASCDAAANPLFARVRLSNAADSAAADAPVRPARALLQGLAVACNAAGSGMHKTCCNSVLLASMLIRAQLRLNRSTSGPPEAHGVLAL